ncbi:MAG: cytochrome c family protein [Hyphomicrobiaceae bacterium]
MPDGNDDRNARSEASQVTGENASEHRRSVLDADPSDHKATSAIRWLIVVAPLLVLGLTGAWLVRSVLIRPFEPAIVSSDRPAPSTPRPRPFLPIPSASSTPSGPRDQIQPDGRPQSAEAKVWSFDAGEVVAGLAGADVERGKSALKICTACHSADRSDGHRLGPRLWNIVGRGKASYPDYAYSQALKAEGGRWTYEDLARYLYDTRSAVRGGKMAFAGIKDPAKLTSVIAYLRTLSDSPEPLPKPQ